MPRFAANLTLLFSDVPLMQRFARAAQAGFRSVEVQFPYEVPAAVMRAELDAQGLRMVLHNLPPGDFARGERGLACLPGREAEFRAGLPLAIRYAQALGVSQLNCLCGIAPAGVDETLLRETAVANLRFAADVLGRAGLRLLIEPVNSRDVPGFWLDRSAKALALMDEVAHPNLYLQYDLYHAQRLEGELTATLRQHLARIAHIQIADNPGRHEPGTGEIQYAFLLAELKKLGYSGAVGCEYLPASARTEDGLGWLAWAREAFNTPEDTATLQRAPRNAI